MRTHATLLVLCSLGLPACGDDSTPGGHDAGGLTTDAGGVAIDAGGATTDAGGATTDAGGATTDAGGATTDAGGGMCQADRESCASGESCCAGLFCCTGVPVPPGSEYCAALCPDSDRALKEGFEAVDADDVLARVASLPITTWSYRRDHGSVRHMGPMAQDFRAAFGLGPTERNIAPVDVDGVALASIQALQRRLATLERDREADRRELARLRRRIAGAR